MGFLMDFPSTRREQEVVTDLVTAELRRHEWDEPFSGRMDYPDHAFFDLALTPRPGPAYASLEGGGRRVMGELVFVPPGVSVLGNGGKGWQQSISCFVSRRLLDEIGGPADWHAADLNACLGIHSPAMRAILERILAELRHPDFGSAAMVEAAGVMLAVEALRFFHGGRAEGARCKGGLAGWRLARIAGRIAAADLPPPSVAELGDLCGLSSAHLMRAYKEETGETLGGAIRAATIRRAGVMLACHDKPIKTIAFELGFASQASFSHAVRRETGCTPAELRARSMKQTRKTA